MAQAPVAAGEKTLVLPVRVNESLAEDFNELAARRGTTRSGLIREGMQLLLEQEVAAS